MRKIVFACATLAAACSASSHVPNEELGLYPSPQDRSELETTSLATITVDGIEIDFTRVWTVVDTYQDDENSGLDAFTPSIMVTQFGALSATVDPVGFLRSNMPEAPTSGELYYGLTGEAPPESIFQYQDLEAVRLNRTREFIAFEPENVVPPDVDKAWVDPVAWTGVPQAHHFERNFITQVPWVCSSPAMNTCQAGQTLPNPVNMFVCGDRSSNSLRGSYVPSWGSCGGMNSGWMRVGAGNVGGTDTTAIVTQAWFGPSSAGEWTSGPAYSVAVNQYVVVDWNAPTYRQLAQLATRSQTTNQQVRFFTTNIIPN